MPNLMQLFDFLQPAHGARIVDTVLNDAALRAEWDGCIKTMAER